MTRLPQNKQTLLTGFSSMLPRSIRIIDSGKFCACRFFAARIKFTGGNTLCKPKGKGTLGRFERWVEVMGGILDVAGIKGFLGNREALHRLSETTWIMAVPLA